MEFTTLHSRTPGSDHCLKILSNMSLPGSWEFQGCRGTSTFASSFWDLRRLIGESDLIVLNGVSLVLHLCEYFTIFPLLSRPLVAVDLVLRKPENPSETVRAWAKRLLLRKVGLFIHYFKDLAGYERYFGIGPDRSGYVPFKPNLRYRHDVEACPAGDYVLCFGQSTRDYDTFFDAVARLPYPAAIPRPDFSRLRIHGSRFTRPLTALPKNVQILDDDRSDEAMIRILQSARLVVIPILRSTLCASGLGVYLNSMLLGKCVIISETPGARDVLSEQALFVPPEDPKALAQMIHAAWENEELRLRTAAAGRIYALSLGGVADLCQRVLELAVKWYSSQTSSPR